MGIFVLTLQNAIVPQITREIYYLFSYGILLQFSVLIYITVHENSFPM